MTRQSERGGRSGDMVWNRFRSLSQSCAPVNIGFEQDLLMHCVTHQFNLVCAETELEDDDLDLLEENLGVDNSESV